MDYFSVTQTAFFSAACLSIALTLILAWQSISHEWIRPFVFGFLAQSLWCVSIGLSYSDYLISSNVALTMETARYFLWFVTLASLLLRRSSFRKWPNLTKATASLLLASCALLFVATSSVMSIKTSYLSLSFAFTAALLLIFTEQTLRNLGATRLVKLAGIGLVCQFTFDAYLYSQLAYSQSLSIGLWQTRAAIAFAVALIVSLGALMFNDHKDKMHFAVTRPVVFYTTSAVLSLIVLAVLSLGAFYVKSLNGYIGSFLFSLALVLALSLIAALLMSRQLKSNVEVFISKHFFNLKYDYREQWLNAISTTTELTPGSDDYYEDILKLVCKTFKSRNGVLWLHRNGQLTAAAKKEFDGDVLEFTSTDEFIKKMVTEDWIFSPSSKNGKISQFNELLPDWFSNNAFWIVAPLISQMKLIGVIAISQPPQSSGVTFEDRDLMTNLTYQISSQILLHQQEELISSNKQMETYNRLSAFIMHDLNNVIAQLALVTRNAERHKSNPAFIEDMLKTVGNSVNRMLELVQKFKPEHSEKPETITASELASKLIEECSDKKPVPTVVIEQDFHFVADSQKFRLAVKNLIRNAQEATPDDGTVTVTVTADTDKRTRSIIVQDSGKGMTRDYINSELFKPFSTTKSENGVGIGAHLTRSYIEHIGARLLVDSELEKGTSFEIVFS